MKISSIEIFELSHDFNIEEQKDGQEEQEGLIGLKISSNKIYFSYQGLRYLNNFAVVNGHLSSTYVYTYNGSTLLCHFK